MRTSNCPDRGWHQFAGMVRSGVPHALDIASALSVSSLTIPSAPRFDPRSADLSFYRPVHLAYRCGVLSQFLSGMEAFKVTQYWQPLKVDRSLQLSLVEEYTAAAGLPMQATEWLADRLQAHSNPLQRGLSDLSLPTDRRAA
jgi:hypothetical protein